MSRTVKLLLFVSVALVAAAFGYLLNAWRFVQPAPVNAGAVLLAAEYPDVAGSRQAMSQWKGRILVVNFWATWCAPCREEIPEFVRLQRELGPQGVQFVGIAIDDRDKVDGFARSMAINYPLLIASAEGIDLSRKAGNRLGGLPFTVVIDRQGAVVTTAVGAVKFEPFRDRLQQLLKP